ncbi:YceI family protein [Actinoplanes sp. GCM10030250]|uniref:YceI family protein n=1 Tax=Actinoplanes sp. GCM10030250 TaxID=3273376 RepID=UPI00360F306D
MTAPTVSPRRVRTRRRLWWALGITAVLLVGLLGAAMAFVAFQTAAAPLTLPPAGSAPPAGPMPAQWRIASGSVAGFRIEQTFLGATSEVTGHTEGVTGAMTTTGNRIDSVEATIDLLSLTTDGKQPAPQYAESLETARFPHTTVRLTEPVPFDAGFTSGATTELTATGELTLHGVTRPITAAVTARRDATGIAVTGSVPIRFADWNIAEPQGYGALGALADHGSAEFLLILHPN